MKIRLEQLNPIIGDLRGNSDLILTALEKAENDGIGLLILPELVVTGYPPQDLLENVYFREKCYRTNEMLVTAAGACALLFGSITPNTSPYGRKMYNSAILCHEGKEIAAVHKTLLPTYDVFDDLRYFEPNTTFSPVLFKGVKLGITICEDIWYNENEVQYHTYQTDPARELKKRGADLIINISASPFTRSKHENRIGMIRNHAKSLGLPVLYCNQTGAHTDIIFDGDTLVMSKEGEMVASTLAFNPSFTDIRFSREKGVEAEPRQKKYTYPESAQERQFLAIQCGLRDYFKKSGLPANVVIGLSGGIDSALAAALAAEALGTGAVLGITMPSDFSSMGSVTDSEELAKNLGIDLIRIPISETIAAYESALKPYFKDLPFGIAEENLQSRVRGTLLMAWANKFGSFLITTGNKSEMATGYATLYGDMNGALAIIGDLYKSEVYSLSVWLNEYYYGREVIPESILAKPPSAELRPDQKDSDSLPDYEILDGILTRYIDLQWNREEIVKDGYESGEVQRILKLVDMNEFKRFQSAPVLKLSSKAFGPGRRWPLVQQWTKNSD
ncbi:MAG: NAD+ synthase [Balneolaceae bacterium]|nr:MAG: NAD+ synthase [Balneolaceae bacterium]